MRTVLHRMLLLALVLLLAPVRPPWGQVLNLSPAEPKIGTQIQVSYDETAAGAGIKGEVLWCWKRC